jgi:hypothetical protein
MDGSTGKAAGVTYWCGERNGDNGDLMCLEWTTDPPKESGIYWAQERGGYVVCVQVKINKYDGIEEWTEVREFMTEDFTETKFYSHWLGPLPVPEPPQ